MYTKLLSVIAIIEIMWGTTSYKYVHTRPISRNIKYNRYI